jgi:biopolymer transport protein ExbB
VATREPQRRFFEVHLAPLVAGEQARLRGGLPVVGTVAALCPLLGLLGTVLGMITTFGGITAGGGVEPDALAKGISQALITTQAGLVMALPLLLMHGYLRAKIDRFLDAVGLRIKKVETLVCGD